MRGNSCVMWRQRSKTPFNLRRARTSVTQQQTLQSYFAAVVADDAGHMGPAVLEMFMINR